MNYTQQDSPAQVVLTADRPIGSVIWLHGLGADGHDFVPIVPELDLPARVALRFIFPHAPRRAVTINDGFEMRAWYDIFAIGQNAREDADGIRQSAAAINALIEKEIAAGIPADRIVLAGFSQGGAIALQTGLRHPQRLAGIMALSTYLPLRDSLAAEQSTANLNVPIFMCHGVQDQVIPIVLARLSCERLQQSGYTVDWREYPMQHQVCMAQIADVQAWLVKIFSA